MNRMTLSELQYRSTVGPTQASCRECSKRVHIPASRACAPLCIEGDNVLVKAISLFKKKHKPAIATETSQGSRDKVEHPVSVTGAAW